VLTVEPQVVETYVRTGKVRLIFRNVLTYGERAERAGEAAASAGQQGQFWQMHKILFDEQPTVETKSGGDLIALLKDFATRLQGLDQTAFAQSLDSHTTLAALKAADAEQRKRGITSQPIFEIGQQRLLGYQSFDVFQKAIEAALK
jgi:protein-disulfide isomerase